MGMVQRLLFIFALLASASAFAETLEVNMDDPNMAYTNEYATDSAIVCPKSLRGQKLKACLARNGIVSAGEEISEDAEALAQSTPRSVH